MTTTTLSKEDQDFLAQCEEEFKDRFTENDEEFMKVYNAEPSKPPIIENWWVSNNVGGRNDRRFNRRYQPYEQYGNRDRGYQDRRNHYDRESNRPSYRGYDGNRQRYRY